MQFNVIFRRSQCVLVVHCLLWVLPGRPLYFKVMTDVMCAIVGSSASPLDNVWGFDVVECLHGRLVFDCW